jgi:ABC-type dipeptide/oligopeptide/nickel transport system ATPase component
MLELNDVGVELVGRAAPVQVLSGISFAVAEGESLGLVGESGSGKSMTLRTILRMLPAGAQVAGSVTFGGEDIGAYGRQALRAFRAGEVSMISQNPQAALNPVYRVRTFMVEGIQAAKPATSAEEALRRSSEMLEQVGIQDVDGCLRSYPHQLSGGMLQRVVIAGSVARGSRLLLADEPTTALDVTTQSEVMAILQECRTDAGMAMVYVTHDLDLAAATCDRVAVMSRGRIVEMGRAEKVLNEPQHPYTRMLVSSKPSLTRRASVPEVTA